MIKRVSLTCTSSKTASTATGSTAEMRLPNSKKSSRPACTLEATEGEMEKGPITNENALFLVALPGLAQMPLSLIKQEAQTLLKNLRRVLAYRSGDFSCAHA